MTVLKRAPSPLPALAIELETNTATKTGATALRAFTNTCPRMEIAVKCGATMPMKAPTRRPTKIRNIKLMLVHFCNNEENLFSISV